jgi:hypothetical protein
MGIGEKVKNAATHAKEGVADAAATIKHGGKNQHGGEVRSRETSTASGLHVTVISRLPPALLTMQTCHMSKHLHLCKVARLADVASDSPC